MLGKRVANLATVAAPKTCTIPLKLYATYGHMEALSSVYMFFHICIPHISNLSLNYIVAKCAMLQKCN